MIKLKKISAIILALTMILTSLTLVFAKEVTEDLTGTLTVNVNMINEDGEPLSSGALVAPGEKVYARVSVGTDYLTSNGQLSLVFDNDFFEPTIVDDEVELTFNSENADIATYGVENQLAILTSKADISAQGLSAINVILGTDKNIKYNISNWLFEIELTVLETAAKGETDDDGEGCIYFNKDDSASPTNEEGFNDFDNVYAGVNYSMKTWAATVASNDKVVLSTNNTVNFAANGGQLSAESVTGTIGKQYNAPTASKTGFEHIGWTLTNSGVNELTKSDGNYTFTMPKTADTYTALWEENIYTIEYYAKEEGKAFSLVYEDSKAYGEKAYLGSKYGATEFKEVLAWYSDENMTQKVDALTVTENTKLYGLLENGSYEARFYDENGALITPVKSYKAGETIPTADIPTLDLGPEYETYSWNPAVTVMPKGGADFYPILVTAFYTATFKYVDGDGNQIEGFADESDDYEVGEEVYAPADAELTGYDFNGWYYLDGEVKKLFVDGSAMPAADRVYYPILDPIEIEIKVIVDGTEKQVILPGYGDDIDLNVIYSELGKVITWYSDAEMTKEIAEGKFTVETTESFSVYGKTSSQMYTATFYDVDGTTQIGEVLSYAAGDAIVAPKAPNKAKDGLKFICWDNDLVMGFADMVFTPIYEEGEYIAKFYLDDSNTTFVEIEQEMGQTFVSTPDDDEVIVPKGYVFNGEWKLADGTLLSAFDCANNEDDVEFFPIFEKNDPVKLLPTDGSVVMIERNAVVETNNTFEETDKKPYGVTTIKAPVIDAYEATDFSSYFVYGIAKNTKKSAVAAMVYVNGEGYAKFTKANGTELTDNDVIGTGCVITVYDNETDTVVEKFTIVVFGDADGDGGISANDTGLVRAQIASPTWKTAGEKAKIKAVDIDCDGSISANDTSMLRAVIAGSKTINVVTGLAG